MIIKGISSSEINETAPTQLTSTDILHIFDIIFAFSQIRLKIILEHLIDFFFWYSVPHRRVFWKSNILHTEKMTRPTETALALYIHIYIHTHTQSTEVKYRITFKTFFKV